MWSVDILLTDNFVGEYVRETVGGFETASEAAFWAIERIDFIGQQIPNIAKILGFKVYQPDS